MSAIALPDLGDEVMFPRLPDDKIARLAEAGERRSFAADEALYEQGERDTPFRLPSSRSIARSFERSHSIENLRKRRFSIQAQDSCSFSGNRDGHPLERARSAS